MTMRSPPALESPQPGPQLPGNRDEPAPMPVRSPDHRIRRSISIWCFRPLNVGPVCYAAGLPAAAVLPFPEHCSCVHSDAPCMSLSSLTTLVLVGKSSEPVPCGHWWLLRTRSVGTQNGSWEAPYSPGHPESEQKLLFLFTDFGRNTHWSSSTCWPSYLSTVISVLAITFAGLQNAAVSSLMFAKPGRVLNMLIKEPHTHVTAVKVSCLLV